MLIISQWMGLFLTISQDQWSELCNRPNPTEFNALGRQATQCQAAGGSMCFCPVTALDVFDLPLQIHSLPASVLLCVQGGWPWICPIERGDTALGDSKKGRSGDLPLPLLVPNLAGSYFLLLKSVASLGQPTLPLCSGNHSLPSGLGTVITPAPASPRLL